MKRNSYYRTMSRQLTKRYAKSYILDGIGVYEVVYFHCHENNGITLFVRCIQGYAISRRSIEKDTRLRIYYFLQYYFNNIGFYLSAFDLGKSNSQGIIY